MAWPLVVGLVLSAMGTAMNANSQAQGGAKERLKALQDKVGAAGGNPPPPPASGGALEQSAAAQTGGPSVAEAIAATSGAPIQPQAPPSMPEVGNAQTGVPPAHYPQDQGQTLTQPSPTGSKYIAGVKENMPRAGQYPVLQRPEPLLGPAPGLGVNQAVGPNYQPGSVSDTPKPNTGVSTMDKIGTGAAIGTTLYDMFAPKKLPPPGLPGGGRWGGQPSVSQLFMNRR